MKARKARPVLRVALLANRGVVRTHLVDLSRPGAVCGVPAYGAIEPLEDVAALTCPRCARWSALLPPSWRWER